MNMVKFIPTKTKITTQALPYRFVNELFHFYELLMGKFTHFDFLRETHKIKVAQWKRGGPITHRSQDRNLALI